MSSENHGCISDVSKPAFTDGSSSTQAWASVAEFARRMKMPAISLSSPNGPAITAFPEVSSEIAWATCCFRIESRSVALVVSEGGSEENDDGDRGDLDFHRCPFRMMRELRLRALKRMSERLGSCLDVKSC